MAREITIAEKAALARTMVQRDPAALAPRMQDAVLAAVGECEAEGVPVKIYECLRSHELAKLYYETKASKAKDGWKTWHFYGLAVDIIHPVHAWGWWESGHAQAAEWRQKVVAIFKKHGMDWGGDWIGFKDRPHFQWGRCRPTPSSTARLLYEQGGLPRVWSAVGAD